MVRTKQQAKLWANFELLSIVSVAALLGYCASQKYQGLAKLKAGGWSHSGTSIGAAILDAGPEDPSIVWPQDSADGRQLQATTSILQGTTSILQPSTSYTPVQDYDDGYNYNMDYEDPPCQSQEGGCTTPYPSEGPSDGPGDIPDFPPSSGPGSEAFDPIGSSFDPGLASSSGLAPPSEGVFSGELEDLDLLDPEDVTDPSSSSTSSSTSTSTSTSTTYSTWTSTSTSTYSTTSVTTSTLTTQSTTTSTLTTIKTFSTVTSTSTSTSTFTTSTTSVSTLSTSSSTSTITSTSTTESTISSTSSSSSTTTSTTTSTTSSTSSSSTSTSTTSSSSLSSSSTSTSTSTSESTGTTVSTATTTSMTSSTTTSTPLFTRSTETTASTTTTSSTTSISSSSTSTTTSTTTSTATWDRLTGVIFLTIDASTTQVRQSVSQTILNYVSPSAPTAKVQVIVSETTGTATRRLEWSKMVPGNRRLTQTRQWEVDYIVTVSSADAIAGQTITAAMRADVDNFIALLEAQLVSLFGVTGSVSLSFSEPPEAGSVEALIAEVVDSSAAQLVDTLLSGNSTRTNLTVNGQQAVAEKVDLAAFANAANGTNETARVPIKVSDDTEIQMPLSVFDDLDTGGGDVIVVAVPLSGDFFQAENATEDEAADTVQTALSIDIFSSEGNRFNVGGLNEPIRIVLPVTNESSASVCAFYDETKSEWSQVDITRATDLEDEGQVICLTVHLSLFGSILKGFLSTLKCSGASLLSKEGFDALGKGDWYLQVTSLALWVVLGTFFLLMMAAIFLDWLRYMDDEWSDKHFLIPEGEIPPPEAVEEAGELALEAKRVGYVAAFLICFEVLRQSCEIFGSVFREMLDEFMGAFFDWFGEVRDICEAICEGVGEACVAASAGQSIVIISASALARSSIRRNAHRNACAKKGVHPDDDYEEALQKVEERASQANDVKQRTSSSSAVNANNADNAEPTHFASTASSTGSSQGGKGPGRSRLKRGSSSKQFTQLSHDPHHDYRVSTLARLHDNHLDQLDEEHDKVHGVCQPMCNAFYQFIAAGPIGETLLFSIYAPSSIRALLLACDILGATCIATFFVEVNGGSPSKDNDPECEDLEEGIGETIGRLIAIGLMSGLFASIPLALLTRLHVRRFITIDYVGSPKYKKQLRVWFVKDCILWIIGLSYAIFCAIYVMLFFANVLPEDHVQWIISAGISFMTDLVLTPFAIVFAPSIMVIILITFLTFYHWKPRAEVVKMLTEEAEAEEAKEQAAQSPAPPEVVATDIPPAPEFTEGDTVAV